MQNLFHVLLLCFVCSCEDFFSLLLQSQFFNNRLRISSLYLFYSVGDNYFLCLFSIIFLFIFVCVSIFFLHLPISFDELKEDSVDDDIVLLKSWPNYA